MASPIALGDTGVEFTHVAREWRCKYALGASGGPTDSAALKKVQAVFAEYVDTLKALPNAECYRFVCGGCGDFKVVLTQPAADHDKWRDAGYAPEAEFLAKIKEIEGITRVETQEITMQKM